jgi:uncharacterized membrane protein YphA (DoxX/SURF4 family)
MARTFLTVIFLKSGIDKVLDPSAAQQYMAAHGIPLTGLFLVGAIIFELVGALSVLLGYKARWGAIALIVFLIPTTLIFHTKFFDPMQVGQLMKNLAILGGLAMVAYYGSGPVSLDTRIASPDRKNKAQSHLVRD